MADTKAPGQAIAEVVLSERHGCARGVQGHLFCRGSNEFGQVFPERAAVVSVPEPVLPTRVAQRASGS